MDPITKFKPHPSPESEPVESLLKLSEYECLETETVDKDSIETELGKRSLPDRSLRRSIADTAPENHQYAGDICWADPGDSLGGTNRIRS